MKKLAQQNKAKVIDLLSERLAFERSGVILYDQVLAQMKKSSQKAFQKLVSEMQEHREQEKAHEEWLEDQIRSLGGDTKKETELAKLVSTESKGIEEVMLNDTELPHLFHALLAAELVDNAGWELLVELADEVDDVEAREDFKKRLHEEEEHLLLVRRVVAALSRSEVTGASPAVEP